MRHVMVRGALHVVQRDHCTVRKSTLRGAGIRSEVIVEATISLNNKHNMLDRILYSRGGNSSRQKEQGTLAFTSTSTALDF